MRAFFIAIGLAIVASNVALADAGNDCFHFNIRSCTLIIEGRVKGDKRAAYHNRGQAYFFKGDNDRAIADYNQAVRLNPKDSVAYANRGNAYSNKGNNDHAIADYDQAIRLDPKAAFYHNRGYGYHNKGEYDHAIADYDQAIRLDPKAAYAYRNRGIVYSDKGEYDHAITDFDQGIRLDPNDAKAYNARAWALFNAARPKGLQAALAEAGSGKAPWQFLRLVKRTH
jgi:tetratricopeptide (TPR) repeat protein